MPRRKRNTGPSKARSLEHASFQLGPERMTIRLMHHQDDPARPYRIHVAVRQGDVLVTSGYYGVDSREAEIRKAYARAKESAGEKGWKPAPSRGGARLRILEALPAPSARALRAAG